MVEYRALPDSKLDDFRAYLTYAFNPTGDRYDPEEAEEPPPPWRVGDRRGVFDGDQLVSVCVHHIFDTQIRGDWFDMGGLSAVATPPEFRRRGHIRTLLEETLHEYRDRDAFISALWAFSDSFYAKYGWATANRYVHQTGPPEAFAFAREYESGEFVRPEKSDWETLNQIQLDHGERYALTVNRTEEWWKNRAFHGWRDDPYLYAWKQDGRMQGYLNYTIDETDDGNSQIRIWDFAYSSHEARMNLFRFLASHQDQIDSVRHGGPVDSILIDLLDDPSKLTYEVKAGPMVRLVDVEEALEAISYPASVDASLTLSVEDGLAAWNDDTFVLEISGGSVDVSRTDDSPDVSMDVGSLSQLFVGYRPIERLALEGDAVIHTESAANALAEAFPEEPVFLRENF